MSANPAAQRHSVLHLINHVRFGLGNVHAAVDLACAQADRGDHVLIASQGGDYEPLLARHGVRHLTLDQERRSPAAVAGMLVALRRMVREHRPDVLHAHMMTGAGLGFLVGRMSGVPLVATVHNGFDPHAVIMGLADTVVGVSRGAADQMVARGVPARKVRSVLNGTVGASRRDFFPRTPATLGSPNVVTICGMHPRKGVLDMIEAFAQVASIRQEVCFYLVGEGPEQPTYEAAALATGYGERIRFLGQLRDTKSVLEQADIFILTSHDEPFGLVLTEAREAGCAMIASDVGGVPEALENGAAGRLIPPRRPDLFAKALLDLLGDPSALALARAASATNLSKWSVGRVAEDYAVVYAEALARRRRNAGRDARAKAPSAI